MVVVVELGSIVEEIGSVLTSKAIVIMVVMAASSRAAAVALFRGKVIQEPQGTVTVLFVTVVVTVVFLLFFRPTAPTAAKTM